MHPRSIPTSATACPVFSSFAASFSALALASAASAVDLSVTSVEVNQAINSGSLTLVAKNPTIVRVKVGVAGSAVAIPNVEAELRVFSNGVEIAGSPFFSNGAIAAPLVPNSAIESHTLNFFCVPPQSNDVDFLVTVNPLRTVVETDYDNNTGALLNKSFLCRKMVDLAYVSVNYVPGGGQPSISMIEPGVGDAFLRGIFKTGDWNYHRSPLGPLTWTQNINNSSNSLLNTISDIRNLQIPGAGYAKPEFIYAWLPGNPYSGNGQAAGIPSAAAFGNTEVNRFQRTFAHEIGHCWGQQHNSSIAGSVGYDVVNGLLDPLDLPPVMPSTKKDVMVAGLLTNEAWVAPVTFNDCINDARSACTPFDGGDGGEGGADDALAGERCLRIAGEYNHATGRIVLQPSLRLDIAEPTVDDASGDAMVRLFDRNGAILSSVRMRTGTARESCSGQPPLDRTPFYAIVPETIAGQSIHRVEIRDVKSGATLARQVRSANAPTATITNIAAGGAAGPAAAGGDPGAVLNGEFDITWIASDADGNLLEATLLYSRDGGDSWIPIAVNQQADALGGENQATISTINLPQSFGTAGVFKIRVTDGMNQSDNEFPMQMAVSGGTPPDVHVISPNSNMTLKQHASLILQASAWDIDDELLPEQDVSWSSNINGPLGVGRLFTTRSLSPGSHVLSLTGTDSSGMSTTKTVNVTVTPRVVRSSDLNFDGQVDGADLAILLGSWGSTGSADLDLNGTVDAADLALLLGSW